MRAFQVTKYKQPVTLGEVTEPTAGADDVLIEVSAASLNHLDEMIRLGKFKLTLPYRTPFVLGHDVAGTVIAVGASVTTFNVGDEVYARPRDGRIGTFAERIAVNVEDISLRPTSITFEEAASLPLVALTAWQALVERGNLQANQKVLIHAGAGGVGSIAIQLAKHLGATVATTVSAPDVEFARELGADIVIDYRTEKFKSILTDFDLVIDSLGADSVRTSMSILKPGGKVVGISGPPDPKFAKSAGLNPILRFVTSIISRKVRRTARQRGVDYEFLFMHASGKQLQKITNLVDAGIIKPVLGRIIDFRELPEALGRIGANGVRGKTVMRIANTDSHKLISNTTENTHDNE